MKKFLIFLVILNIIIISLLLTGRFISTAGFKTNEIKIEVNELNDSYDGLKIVHFSDIHYGRTVDKEKLESIVEEINRINPDIVAFTGDLFDKDRPISINEQKEVAAILKKINANLGKYIISGNHDNNDSWENMINEMDFYNLNDKNTLIYNKNNKPIVLSGISSNLNSNYKIEEKIIPINTYFNSLEGNPVYSILLIHEPDYLSKINTNNYNLILAGHSHNGQVKLPFIGAVILPEGAKTYYDDYYKINNTDLYVSNGLGTSKINFRFLNKPSINFYRIVKK